MYPEKDTLSLIYNFSPNTLPRSRHERAFQVAVGVKNLSANAGDIRDMGLIPGSGRSPGGRHGESAHGQTSLAGYSPWGRKDMKNPNWGTFQKIIWHPSKISVAWKTKQSWGNCSRLKEIISNPGLPWLFRPERICLQWRRHVFDPWVRKIPWRMEWLPISLFLPGKFHGQRSLEGYSPWSCKESDMTEWLTHTHA